MKKFFISIFIIMAFLLMPKKITMTDVLNQDETIVYINTFQSLNLNNLNDDHYDFIGWYGTNDEKKEIINNPIMNTSVNAKWMPKKYSITYLVDDDTTIKNKVKYYEYIKSETTKLPIAFKQNYVFIGWELNGEVINELPAGYDKNISIKPVFQPENYKITYNLDGGTMNNPVQTYEYGSFPKIDNPTKKGYDFAGWYIDEDHTEKFSFNEDISGDITLYANWTKKVIKNINQSTATTTDYSREIPSTESSNVNQGDSLTIGSYSAKITYEIGQWVVDQENLASYFNYYNKATIADHRYQGFSVIENIAIGSQATLILNGQQQTLTLASRYLGYNTGSNLYTTDWIDATTINDGWLIMYTCQSGSSGYDVVITFWN